MNKTELVAAIAGGADVALIPEIPYDINKAVEKIIERNTIQDFNMEVIRIWKTKKRE